jgi:hypothetical protein
MRGPGMVPGAYLGVPMKKQVKKLGLTKETLRSLNPKSGQIAGGTASTNDCPYTFDLTCECGYSGAWTCGCQSNEVACVHFTTR